VHDQTVADDYYSDMERVEQRLKIAQQAAGTEEHNDDEPLNNDERGHLLDLADQLAAPGLSPEVRIDLVERIRLVLNHNTLPGMDERIEQENGRRPRGPPVALSRLPLGK